MRGSSLRASLRCIVIKAGSNGTWVKRKKLINPGGQPVKRHIQFRCTMKRECLILPLQIIYRLKALSALLVLKKPKQPFLAVDWRVGPRLSTLIWHKKICSHHLKPAPYTAPKAYCYCQFEIGSLCLPGWRPNQFFQPSAPHTPQVVQFGRHHPI